MMKSTYAVQKDFAAHSPVNLMDSRVYSRKANYKGLLDTDDCQGNQINDLDNDHHQNNHYVENVQMASTNELKYNKRIKTLIENERNGNYVPQNYLRDNQNQEEIVQTSVQIGQQNKQNDSCYEQNMGYTLPRNECDRDYTNKKNLKKSQLAYNHMILQDNVNVNSNNDTIDVRQANDVNHLAQHFNDRLQTQSISRTYNPHCGNKLNENTKPLISTYQTLPNDTLNGTLHQQCEQSYGKSYQKHECE